jgi:4-amino-4-deoxy-L-arabinose transferase-like glycosyltransferase
VQVAVIVPFLGRYGWDRDELYFLSAAKRPALGYVDFPPLVAWLGWLVHAVFGDSLDALRLTGVVLMVVADVLVVLMARELGGGRGGQLLAGVIWAFSPYALGAGSIFHPTWLDLVCWVALLYVVLLALNRDRPHLWLAAGAVAGVGLEAKYTIVVLLVAILVGLLVAGRHALRTPWPWLGLALAVLLLVPNLVWQAQHGWASVHFASSQNAKTADDTPPGTYLAEQLFLGVGVLVAVVGVIWLWRRRPWLRPLALVPPVVTVLFFVERGRAYYPLPGDSIAVAAGAVALAGWFAAASTWRRLAVVVPLVAVQALLLVLIAPVVLPVRSTSSMVGSGVWKDSFYKDEIGWPELTEQTAAAWRRLPPRERADGAIVARNYGEASALERYGPSDGLPQPLSGHLTWQYWRPALLPQRYALLVGFDPDEIRRLCVRSQRLAVIDNRWHLDNQERGETITACRLDGSLGSLWSRAIATTRL